MSSEIKCFICNNCFTKQHSLTRHLRDVHHINVLEKDFPFEQYSNKCLEGCNSSFSTLARLRKHLFIKHKCVGMNKVIMKKFSTKEAFDVWYKGICSSSNVQYVAHKGRRKTGSVTHYNCNRGGKHTDRITSGKRKRRYGSSKTGATCTHQIELFKRNDSEYYEVTFFKEHYGHSFDPFQIRLSSEDRIQLLEKIKQGIPWKKIIEDARVQGNPDNLKRINVLTYRDLRNLCIVNNINYTDLAPPRKPVLKARSSKQTKGKSKTQILESDELHSEIEEIIPSIFLDQPDSSPEKKYYNLEELISSVVNSLNDTGGHHDFDLNIKEDHIENVNEEPKLAEPEQRQYSSKESTDALKKHVFCRLNLIMDELKSVQDDEPFLIEVLQKMEQFSGEYEALKRNYSYDNVSFLI